MAEVESSPDLKRAVQDFWNTEPCGTRYLADAADFEAHANGRFRLEPFIPEFAQFAASRGLRVLEIGVGMGADYLEWLKAGAVATGIDLSQTSLERARQRCQARGYDPDLRVADAERMPFADDSFDVIYSYGVMHHSPRTPECIQEAWRVLRPGGTARIMIYHHPSVVGFLLWLRYGLLRGKSLRRAVYDHLESPGTKTYTREEAQKLMANFENVETRVVFSPGDLLMNEPSARYQHPLYRMIWKLFPRPLIRTFAGRWGLFLLITARKPVHAGEQA
jgi:ubiquinone/menaquinone biosynthesis C-methylase UbiE